MSAVSPPTHARQADPAHEAHVEVGFLKKYIFSIDHKVIGIQFLFMGLMFMVVGGLLAMLIRWQMAWPDAETQGKDHPVPILGLALWGKPDAAAELGKIESVDLATKTVTVRGIGSFDTRVGDSVTVNPTGGPPISGQVRAIDDHVASIEVAAPPAGAVIKAGDVVKGRRVPGSMPPDFYTMVFSMHATIMIFFVIIPLLVGTFGNYLIPLKIGAPDMAFPFLNGLVFWSALPAGAIMVASFFMPHGPAGAGWTSYPPLSSIQQDAKPWDHTARWYVYQRPTSGLETIGGYLRIGGKVVTLADAKFQNGVLIASLPAGIGNDLVEKSNAAAKSALDAYKKQTHKPLPGVAVQVKAMGEATPAHVHNG